jgi:hypothetical protein
VVAGLLGYEVAGVEVTRLRGAGIWVGSRFDGQDCPSSTHPGVYGKKHTYRTLHIYDIVDGKLASFREVPGGSVRFRQRVGGIGEVTRTH